MKTNHLLTLRYKSTMVYNVHMIIYFGLLKILGFKLTVIPICDLLVAIMIIWGVINNKLIYK